MICISIAQESRRLALADMLNAVMSGADLIEVRLDCFENEPNFSELLGAKRKPVIFSCRRPEDGGNWNGSEDDRLKMLRQAIISKADYVEIELDAADDIRPFPPAKRVISYTNLKETPSDIAAIYAEAQTKKPDVIKLVCRARTPEEAWPLVQIMAKPVVPTVVVGLGRPGTLLAVMGKKVGAPWTYAALERGAEAYPGQPTVSDLDRVYRYREIDRSTRLVGVTGLGEREYVTTALLNAAFAGRDLPVRCLPIQVGNLKVFRKVLEAVKAVGVILEEAWQNSLRDLAAALDPAAEAVMAGDLLVPRDNQWLGCNVAGPALIGALERVLRTKDSVDPEQPFKNQMTMVVGTNMTARSLLHFLKEAGAPTMVTSRDRDGAQRLAQRVGCRFVPFEAMYTTLHEVMILCGDPAPEGSDEEPEAYDIRPGYLRPGMLVVDLTCLPRPSALVKEARARGCLVLTPEEQLVSQVQAQAKRIAGGADFDPAPLHELFADLVPDYEE